MPGTETLQRCIRDADAAPRCSRRSRHGVRSLQGNGSHLRPSRVCCYSGRSVLAHGAWWNGGPLPVRACCSLSSCAAPATTPGSSVSSTSCCNWRTPWLRRPRAARGELPARVLRYGGTASARRAYRWQPRGPQLPVSGPGCRSHRRLWVCISRWKRARPRDLPGRVPRPAVLLSGRQD